MKRSAEGNQPRIVRPENVMTFQRAPKIGQLFDFVGERSRLCREKDRIDGTRGSAGDDFEFQIWEMLCDASKEADLISRAGTSTREHDGKIAALFFPPLRYFNKLRHAHETQPFQRSCQHNICV